MSALRAIQKKSLERYNIVQTLKGQVSRGQLQSLLHCSGSTISRMSQSPTYQAYRDLVRQNALTHKAKVKASQLAFKEPVNVPIAKTNDLSKLNDLACISALNSQLAEIKKINIQLITVIELLTSLSKKKFLF